MLRLLAVAVTANILLAAPALAAEEPCSCPCKTAKAAARADSPPRDPNFWANHFTTSMEAPR